MTDIEPTELPEESELQPPAEVDEAPQAEADDTPQAEVDYTPQAEVDDASADLEVVALSVEAAESPSPADVSSHPPKLPPITRRQLLMVGAAAVPCLIGAGVVFEWLSGLGADETPVDPIVARYDPEAHRWGFVVDTAACIGCGKCVVACKQENNVPLGPETRTWVERRILTSDGVVHVDSPEAGIGGFVAAAAAVEPNEIRASRFVPRLCMQCELSPCTTVCPVGATYRTADGVILVDETRCIGCGYCVVSCPYGARYIVPAGERTPTGVAGVADKCTFCYHRITRGQKPACVDVCPVGARKFGDLNDPNSDVNVALRQESSRVLRPQLGTKPRVFYLGLEDELA